MLPTLGVRLLFFTLTLPLLLAGPRAVASPAARGAKPTLAVVREGFIRRLSEEAKRQPDLLSQAHAHPSLRLLAWHQSTAIDSPRKPLGDDYDQMYRAVRELSISDHGRLEYDRGRPATREHLQYARLSSLDDVASLVNRRLLLDAHKHDSTVATVAEAVPVLDRLARTAAPRQWYRGHTLGDAVNEGVNGADAVLLTAMHQALHGSAAAAPLAAAKGAWLYLSPLPTRAQQMDGRGPSFPSLWVANGQGLRLADEAALRAFAIHDRAALDLRIEDAMRAIAPEDY